MRLTVVVIILLNIIHQMLSKKHYIKLDSTRIYENATIGHKIKDVKNEILKLENKPYLQLNNFQLINQNYRSRNEYLLNINAYFIIDSLTGIIQLIKLIDLETLCNTNCNFQNECYLRFHLKCEYERDSFGYFTFDLFIDDINEHVPQFEISNLVFNISEEISPLYIHIGKFANDNDCYDRNRLKYTLISNDSYINSRVKLIEDTEYQLLYLQITQSIDREVIETVRLDLIASDNGLVPHAYGSSLQITLNLIDINDNAPKFNETQINFNLKENFQPLKEILQVKAFDLDYGENARVTYTIEDSNDLIDEYFFLNSSNGYLFLLKQIDYELHKEFNLMIKATDNCLDLNSIKSTISFVNINILDENDNAPLISIYEWMPYYFQSKNKLKEFNLITQTMIKHETISLLNVSYENARLLAVLTVLDRDSGKNGQINNLTLNILNEDSQEFLIEEYKSEENPLNKQNIKVFFLKTNSNGYFKYEKYDLQFEASDFGLERVLHGILKFQIRFNTKEKGIQVEYKIILSENNQIPTYLVPISLMDDFELNTQIVSFEFRKNSSSCSSSNPILFVNLDQNLIYLNSTLDYEECQNYFLELILIDSYEKNLNIKIHLEITDQNEYKPRFNMNKYLFYVNENETFIGKLEAIDLDLNSKTSYKFEYIYLNKRYKEIAISNYIYLNETNGILSLKQNPNRSLDFKFQIKAIDKDFPSFYDICLVQVVFIMKNDRKAFFHYEVFNLKQLGLKETTTKDGLDEHHVVFNYDLIENALVEDICSLLKISTTRKYFIIYVKFKFELINLKIFEFDQLKLSLIDNNKNLMLFIDDNGVLKLTTLRRGSYFCTFYVQISDYSNQREFSNQIAFKLLIVNNQTFVSLSSIEESLFKDESQFLYVETFKNSLVINKQPNSHSNKTFSLFNKNIDRKDFLFYSYQMLKTTIELIIETPIFVLVLLSVFFAFTLILCSTYCIMMNYSKCKLNKYCLRSLWRRTSDYDNKINTNKYQTPNMYFDSPILIRKRYLSG